MFHTREWILVASFLLAGAAHADDAKIAAARASLAAERASILKNFETCTSTATDIVAEGVAAYPATKIFEFNVKSDKARGRFCLCFNGAALALKQKDGSYKDGALTEAGNKDLLKVTLDCAAYFGD
jgi:hypothetical protein